MWCSQKIKINNFFLPLKKSSNHTPHTWQIQGLNTEGLAPKRMLLAMVLLCVSVSRVSRGKGCANGGAPRLDVQPEPPSACGA